jgi:hypothetical protein
MPAARMSQLAAAALSLDLAHLARIRIVEHADRRSAAILMADLEASSPLACRLSSTQYFAFARVLVRAADAASSTRVGLSAAMPEMEWSRSSSPNRPNRNQPPRDRASRPLERCATV